MLVPGSKKPFSWCRLDYAQPEGVGQLVLGIAKHTTSRRRQRVWDHSQTQHRWRCPKISQWASMGMSIHDSSGAPSPIPKEPTFGSRHVWTRPNMFQKGWWFKGALLPLKIDVVRGNPAV